jgi:hypothetical protein
MSVCDLANNFTTYRNKVVVVRGVYYYGLRREDCPQKCASGVWPSFIELEGGAYGVWDALSKVEKTVESDAKSSGQRFELWVTVTGRLHAATKFRPCDRETWGGYGHLNSFPAQIVVDKVSDIEVKVNPQSLFDYSNVYHGAL